MPTKTQSQPKKKPMQSSAGNPFVWVEVPVTNLERAKTFYGNVFGFKFEMNEMYGYKMAMFSSAPDRYGSGGALIQGESYVPSYDGAVVYFHTSDIDGTLKKAFEAGGKLVQKKKSIGQHGFIAYFEDCEGNRIALHSMQ